MLKQLIKTRRDWSATILRLTLGLVILPHGLQKVFGWFGGGGVSGTLGFFESMGIPMLLGIIVIVTEFAGSLALIVGAGGRIAAASIAAVMLGAVATVHLSNGFFMNWSGGASGEGFEYHLLAVAIATGVMIKGSGALSVDRLVAQEAA